MRVHPTTHSYEQLRAEVVRWRSGAVLVAVLVLVGVVEAVLWARVAPGEQYYVTTAGSYGGVQTASLHQFTDIAIFALLAICVGAAAGSATWHWRSIRGSATVLALGGANLLGALTAYLLGRVLATGVDPASVGTPAAQTVVTAAPVLGNVLVLVVQPGLAVLVYTFLAAWNGRPDLSRPDPEALVPDGLTPGAGMPRTDR